MCWMGRREIAILVGTKEVGGCPGRKVKMGSIDRWLPKTEARAAARLDRPPDQGRSGEEGSTTVEYAIGAVSAAAFAGLLLAVLKSGGVKGMLTSIIQSALSL